MIRAKNSFRKGGNQHKEENKFAEYDYTSKLVMLKIVVQTNGALFWRCFLGSMCFYGVVLNIKIFNTCPSKNHPIFTHAMCKSASKPL